MAGGTEVSTGNGHGRASSASPLRGERVVGLVPGERGVAGERVGAGASELGRTTASAAGGVASCREGELGPRRGSTGEQRLAGGGLFWC